MSNNRIYLKCKVCGESVFLAKSFASGYYQAVYSPEEQQRRLEEFYETHAFCRGNNSDGLYELEYEDPPEEEPIDVAPVVHGRWDENGRCTHCGGHAPYYGMASTYFCSPYCFSCGAKMDGERRNDVEIR